jgi:hypothetical protein
MVDATLRPLDETPASSSCMAKLDRLRWVSCDWFEIRGYRFGVRSTSAVFGSWIDDVLRAYAVDGPSEPGQTAQYALVVEDLASSSGRANTTMHILYSGTLDVVRSTDLRAVARAFLAEVESVTFPLRDDAVYLEASVIANTDRTILIPSLMVPLINTAARRFPASMGIRLPGLVSVALDPESGRLVPVKRTLAIDPDAIGTIPDVFPVDGHDDRVFVDREMPIDRVVVFPQVWDPGVRAASRGTALFGLSRQIRNIRMIGGQGVTTLGRVLAAADVLEVQWGSSRQFVEMVIEIVEREAAATDDREPVIA